MVEEAAPMRRGLKLVVSIQPHCPIVELRGIPDEEGIETSHSPRSAECIVVEEGDPRRGGGLKQCDEVLHLIRSACLSAPPMRRGLKLDGVGP